MRYWARSAAAWVVAATVAIAVAGAAGADPGAAGTALTADHYGVIAGSADAPVQLELFCDPQCPECAKFESATGAALGRELAAGRVALTYRWLSFLDARRHNDTSARVGNALMAAADPTTPAAAYQALVESLYRAGGNPDTEAIAAASRASGIPAPVADRIASGAPAVDTVSLNAFNRVRLTQVNPQNPGTPTVYDLKSGTVVDTDAPGWLDRLVAGG